MRALIRIFAVIGVVTVVVGSYLCASMLLRGYSARERPSAMETFLARHARGMATPAAAKWTQNPFPATEAALAEGRAHWADHCAQCHGLDGSGATDIGRNVYPKAPDMRAAATQNLSDGELYYIIANGIRFTAMPAWGGMHTPEETWYLVQFIRRLPRISPEELKQMQRAMPMEMNEHHNQH